MNTTTTEPDELHQTAARGVEALNLMVAERDHLRRKTDTLEVNIALLTQDCENLRRQLLVASAERDHYMRHSVEITAHLNDIQIVINEAIKAAALINFRPATVRGPKPDPVSATDQAQLEALVARLPHNGGSGNA